MHELVIIETGHIDARFKHDEGEVRVTLFWGIKLSEVTQSSNVRISDRSSRQMGTLKF